MNTDKLSKLQQIASGSQYATASSYDNSEKINNEFLKQKIKTIVNSTKAMYKNDTFRGFESFQEQTKNIPLVNDEIKEWYWNTYLNYDESFKDKVKENLISDTEIDLESLDTAVKKEHYLRDKVSRWPKWLVEEFKDDLQNFSTKNAHSNLNKAKLLYQDDLSKRLFKLNDQDLDPDVGESVHLADMLKLEKMNLLDVAKSFNGRLGVMGSNKEFILANDLKDISEVYKNRNAQTPSIEEQLVIDELAPDFISNHVKAKLLNQREKINLDNKVTESLAANILESGSLSRDKWKEAFSLFDKPDYEQLIQRAIVGEINAGRVYSDEELVKTIWSSMNEYKDYFNNTLDEGNNNATNS
jgi:hypothetical protein